VDKHLEKPAATLGPILKAWLPPTIWAAVLFGLSSIPGSRLPSVHISLGDKIAHACVYSVLGALCFRALRRGTTIRPGRAVVISILMTMGFGISDEIHQIFVPMRSSDVLDVLADVLGGSLGTFGGYLTRPSGGYRKNP
jgi:VanZ family protein